MKNYGTLYEKPFVFLFQARRVDIGEYQASVDRINELHAELSSKPEDTSELDVKVEELNTTWQTFNTAVDKIAWMKKPVRIEGIRKR